MNILPLLFTDESETYKVEELIDYFLSWTLRCADSKYSENVTLNQYSKMILSKILFDDAKFLENKIVSNVKTWKQWANIDVCAHVLIDNEKFALIIENKMYSSIRDGQLLKYVSLANEFYKDKPEFVQKFIFIRPDYEHEIRFDEKVKCKSLGYNYFNLAELQEILPQQKTGNDLFDEFWFNWNNKTATNSR